MAFSIFPKDTGNLRRAVLSAALGSKQNFLDVNHPYRFMLDIDVPYAAPVTNMPTEWLSHPGSHKAKGRRTRSRHDGHVLRDKNAKAGWWQEILRNARNRALTLEQAWQRGSVIQILADMRARALFYGTVILSRNTPMDMWASQLISVRTR